MDPFDYFHHVSCFRSTALILIKEILVMDEGLVGTIIIREMTTFENLEIFKAVDVIFDLTQRDPKMMDDKAFRLYYFLHFEGHLPLLSFKLQPLQTLESHLSNRIWLMI